MKATYPKTKAAGVFNVLSSFACLIAIAVIAYLLFTNQFKIVKEEEAQNFANLGLIVVVPFTLLHLAVLFIGFLTQLLRGLKLKSASEDGEIGIASYIVTLIVKILCLAYYIFICYLFLDVAVGGATVLILTSIVIVTMLFTMIFEFACKSEVLD